jgi:hypothetical protein
VFTCMNVVVESSNTDGRFGSVSDDDEIDSLDGDQMTKITRVLIIVASYIQIQL